MRNVLNPTVSVVIPTYNRASFLGVAVASVRAQTYACAEIVIVDDGSTDDTAQVVGTLGDGIRYVRQANAGPAAARNCGIQQASSDLIAFLDTDDRWLPDKIALQVKALQADPSVALVCADMSIEDEAGVTQVESNFALRGLHAMFAHLDGRAIPDAPRLLLRINFVNTSTALVRRDVLLALNGFDARLRYGEDLELWLRIAARHGIACIPSVQEIRVEHATNVTKSVEPMLLGYVQLAEILREWAQDVMPKWGISADRYVANCLNDLGYWYFSQSKMTRARQVLTHSLRVQPTFRAAIYTIASTLPITLVNFVRRLKHRQNRV